MYIKYFLQRHYKVQIINATTSSDNYDLLEISNSLVNYSFSANLTLKQTITTAQHYTYLQLILPKSQRDIINKTTDLCLFLEKPYLDPLVKIVFMDLSQSGKMFEKCPIEARNYNLMNYTPNGDRLPPFLPVSQFKLIYKMFLRSDELNVKVAVTIEIFGVIKRQRNL